MIEFLGFAYIALVLIFAVVFVAKVLWGEIENPDESDREWMENNKRHPVLRSLMYVGLAFGWPYYVLRILYKEIKKGIWYKS